MVNYNFSPKSVASIVENMDWVSFYDEKINNCILNLKPDSFPESYFINVIEPQLISIFLQREEIDPIKSKIHTSIQNWTMQATIKSYFLIRILQLIPKEIIETQNSENKYHDIDLGPLPEDIFNKMNFSEKKLWREGSNLIYFRRSCVNQFVSLFFSESFFVAESLLRAIAAGFCFEFALKTITPGLVIQHKEIFEVINRKAKHNSSKINCLICPISKNCLEDSIFDRLNEAYLLLYHLRVIKDYKSSNLTAININQILEKDFLNRIFKIICLIEDIEGRIYKNYWFNPRTMKESYNFLSIIN